MPPETTGSGRFEQVFLRLLLPYRYFFTFLSPLCLAAIYPELLYVWALSQLLTGADIDYRLRVIYGHKDPNATRFFMVLFSLGGAGLIGIVVYLDQMHPALLASAFAAGISLGLYFLKLEGQGTRMAIWEYAHFPVTWATLLLPVEIAYFVAALFLLGSMEIFVFRYLRAGRVRDFLRISYFLDIDLKYLVFRVSDFAIYWHLALQAALVGYWQYLFIQLLGFARSIVPIFGAFLTNYLSTERDRVVSLIYSKRRVLQIIGGLLGLGGILVTHWVLPLSVFMLWLLRLNQYVEERRFGLRETIILTASIGLSVSILPLYAFFFCFAFLNAVWDLPDEVS